jgi:3-dehydrotetronate 4-kinase
MILGVIADDFTGATDVASMLVRGGMRTVLSLGVPQDPLPEAAAMVVALKSRTCPAEEAIRDSLAALRRLRSAGARQFYFKYCSTFDSTPAGNIGPVAEALMAELNTPFTIACPAFPENGRTVYNGHLFVGEGLLSESGMRHHPLTPMTDAHLVRVLQAQAQGRVALASMRVVGQGPAALRQHFQELAAAGTRFAIVDAISNPDVFTIAEASDQLTLLTGGSGVALGLPAVYQRAGWLQTDGQAADLPAVGGAQVVLSGSCSQATREQVARWHAQGRPSFQLDPLALAEGVDQVREALRYWQQQGLAPTLFYATAEPEAVQHAQQVLGVQQAGECVERALAQLATALAAAGVRRWVVAGGETSGAVVQALGAHQLRIGPTISPGVPWTQVEGRPCLLALKSGNFGDADFFSRALAMTA